MRRSVQMRLECAAATALNPLAGIAYRAEDGVDPHEVEEMILRAPKEVGDGLDAEKRFVLVDLTHAAAGEMAPKSFDPLHMRGVAVMFPFLEPSLMELVFGSAWDERFRLDTAKGPLKALLAESVPPDMVYRPKASLIGDLTRTFGEPEMHDFIGDVVLAPEAPLRPFFNAAEVESMLDMCRKREEMSIGSYYFLWTVTFASGWLRGLV